jgi:asparagine synthase (glutamine-hydrolysing)
MHVPGQLRCSPAKETPLSGIALVASLTGAPVRAGATAGMVEAMAHRAWHGWDSANLPWACLSHLHAWTTPEEEGEVQPIHRPDRGYTLALDGRLDDREGLSMALDLSSAGGAPSDAELAAAAWERWGDGFVGRLLGPFAVVVLDHRRRRSVLARDPLGDRGIVYARVGDLLVAASEECGVLAHPAVGDRLDEVAAAAFFAIAAPPGDRTFFATVRTVPPATLLTGENGSLRSHRYWELSLDGAAPASDDEMAERFRETLRAAVRARIRGGGRCAVVMSGGMDSTSIATLAARETAEPVQAVSWVFDEFPEADERPYMGAVAALPNIEWHPINGDDAWTLRDEAGWVASPNAPFETLHRGLWNRAYRVGRDHGATIALTGEFGDHLFWGGEYWLADLLRARMFFAAGVKLAAHGWWYGVRRATAAVTFRAALGATVRRREGEQRPPFWLTPRARDLLTDELHAARGGGAGGARAAARTRLAWDPLYALGPRLNAFYFSSAGVDLRFPFRDRRLVELVAALPAYALHRPGWGKWLLRRAMKGVLPEPVRRRRRVTRLDGPVRKGLLDRERARVDGFLAAPTGTWRQWVDGGWLDAVLPRWLRGPRDEASALVPWHCLCWEIWRSRPAASRTVLESCGDGVTTGVQE